MSKSLFLSHKHFENGCNWPHCCWTDCRQTAYQEPLRYCGSVPWRLLNWYRNVCLSRVSTYPINTHDENMNDYRCCNIWIVHRSEVSYWRNPMHHWTVHTTKPSTAVILISLPMMISNDHSSCIFINVHTGDHSQLVSYNDIDHIDNNDNEYLWFTEYIEILNIVKMCHCTHLY